MLTLFSTGMLKADTIDDLQDKIDIANKSNVFFSSSERFV
jgi:hypothetical protein